MNSGLHNSRSPWLLISHVRLVRPASQAIVLVQYLAPLRALVHYYGYLLSALPADSPPAATHVDSGTLAPRHPDPPGGPIMTRMGMIG